MHKPKPKHSVYVVSQTTLGVDDMFRKHGWEVFRDWEKPRENKIDLVVFCGGADISPALYGEERLAGTSCNPSRDAFEVDVFTHYKDKTAIAGVCRGGQLVNVLNGGKLYQDVNNHAGQDHVVYDIRKIGKRKEIIVSSYHHQMMIPPEKNGICIAWGSRSTVKRNAEEKLVLSKPEYDPEVVVFPETRQLAVQFHPEFGPKSCEDYFFELVKDYCGLEDCV